METTAELQIAVMHFVLLKLINKAAACLYSCNYNLLFDYFCITLWINEVNLCVGVEEIVKFF